MCQNRAIYKVAIYPMAEPFNFRLPRSFQNVEFYTPRRLVPDAILGFG